MRKPPRNGAAFLLLLSCVLGAAAGSAFAAPLAGDLDGDGSVDADDEPWLQGLYGTSSGELGFDAAADLDADGRIDFRDLAIFGATFGASGGDVDSTPPGLFVTLNAIPDDMNDLLVVPPDSFQITLSFDSAGGSVVDAASLSVLSSEDIGALPALSELAPNFASGASAATWTIPLGSELGRTSHFVTVDIRDAAGNLTSDIYGFAVRDFSFGPPLGSLQTVFLDFDQDRSLRTEVDFLEDLRAYGLSSTLHPTIETQMRDAIVLEILARVRPYYGRNPDGSAGADPVNIAFVDTQPGAAHSRLCVGGESPQGANFLGSAPLDLNNLGENTDLCALGPSFGVFPEAIDNLWGGSAEYQAAFGPVDPGLGGTPVGEDPLDATVLSPSFDPATASPAELARWGAIVNAVDAFSQTLATAIAHENGHMLGLVAPGATPGGLFGGSAGGSQDHNEKPGGGIPAENYLMNQGGSFSFDEMTGRNGVPLPVFRTLGWAYLRDRIVLNSQVTGLFPAPTLTSVDPNPVDIKPPQSATVTIHGTNFLDTPSVELITEGDPTPNQLLNETFIDANTITGVVSKFLVPPGLYDVHLINADGQEVTLVDGLEVE